MLSNRQRRSIERHKEVMTGLMCDSNTVQLTRHEDTLGNVDWRVKCIDYRGFNRGGVSTPRYESAVKNMQFFASLITFEINTREVVPISLREVL